MAVFSIIVAVSENGVIGNGNRLIWHMPADLRRFKQLTMGHVVVMGRKTFESIGKPLPGRTNVILTRDESFHPEGCEVMRSLEEVIARYKEEDEIFIAGGGKVYSAALRHSVKIYLTRIHHQFEGDTFFPFLKPQEWKVMEHVRYHADEKNPYDYSFITYLRKFSGD